jgi:hypothetical protein
VTDIPPPNDGPPKGDRPVLVAQLERPGQTTPRETPGVNVPPFKNITVPDKWQRSDNQGRDIRFQVTTFSPPGKPDVQLGVQYAGLPVNDEAANALNDALQTGKGSKLPRVLYVEDPANPDKITPAQHALFQKLAGALGSNSVGANQLNSDGKTHHPYHIKSAEVVTINGQDVLKVDGYFERADHTISNYSSNLFVPMKTATGTEIQQVWLQAKNQSDYTANRATFDRAINSMTW